jgi:hypothetical protein
VLYSNTKDKKENRPLTLINKYFDTGTIGFEFFLEKPESIFDFKLFHKDNKNFMKFRFTVSGIVIKTYSDEG